MQRPQPHPHLISGWNFTTHESLQELSSPISCSTPFLDSLCSSHTCLLSSASGPCTCKDSTCKNHWTPKSSIFNCGEQTNRRWRGRDLLLLRILCFVVWIVSPCHHSYRFKKNNQVDIYTKQPNASPQIMIYINTFWHEQWEFLWTVEAVVEQRFNSAKIRRKIFAIFLVDTLAENFETTSVDRISLPGPAGNIGGSPRPKSDHQAVSKPSNQCNRQIIPQRKRRTPDLRSRLFWSSPFTGTMEDAEVIGCSPSFQVAGNSGREDSGEHSQKASALGWMTALVLALPFTSSCPPLTSQFLSMKQGDTAIIRTEANGDVYEGLLSTGPVTKFMLVLNSRDSNSHLRLPLSPQPLPNLHPLQAASRLLSKLRSKHITE